MSLMENLLGIVGAAALEQGEAHVKVVHLKIGEMAGVSVDALRFAFDCLSPGTVVEGGRLEIETVPLSVRCARCGATWKPEEFVFVCGSCGSPEIEILAGREMEVDYILVDEDKEGQSEPHEPG
jgi:hydrogenase nickel incorporation protein HypA/HybF